MAEAQALFIAGCPFCRITRRPAPYAREIVFRRLSKPLGWIATWGEVVAESITLYHGHKAILDAFAVGSRYTTYHQSD